MGKFNEYLEKNHEKVFSILEILISFKFGFVTIIVPMFLVLIFLIMFICLKIDTLLIISASFSSVLPYSVAFFVGAIIVYLLLSAKFPNYDKDSSEKINPADLMIIIFASIIYMSWIISDYSLFTPKFYESFIKVISGFGTFVVAIIAVANAEQSKKQLQEMEKQRKAQTEPDLIADDDFTIYFHNCNEFLKGISELKGSYISEELGIWNKSFKKPVDYENRILDALNSPADAITKEERLRYLLLNYENDVGVKIYNVGKGIAKKVICTWECDFDNMFNSFLNKNTEYPIFRKEILDPFITYDIGEYHFTTTDPKFSVNMSYNLLLSSESSEKYLNVSLPKQILKLLGYVCKKQNGAIIHSPLYLTVKYDGIGDISNVQKKYEIKLDSMGPISYLEVPHARTIENYVDGVRFTFIVKDITEETIEKIK